MNIGVKYCGGCNPFYNRRRVLDSLTELFKEEVFETANELNNYDIILVINGCNRSCANHSLIKGRVKIFINSQADCLRAVDLIYDETNLNRRLSIELE